MIAKSKKRTLPVLLTVLTMFFFFKNTFAQTKTNYIRIAKITVDSAKLESYKAALKEEIESLNRQIK